MIINLVKIGNSKGIRIPKTILEQCEIESEVDLEIEGKNIILKPINKEPRQNWHNSFKRMHKNNDDNLLIDDGLDIEMDDLEW